MTQNQYRSGENCSKSGKYTEYSSDNKVLNKDVNVEQGKKSPPTQQKDSYFKKQG